MAYCNGQLKQKLLQFPTVSLLRRKGLSNPIPPLGPTGSRECPKPEAHQRYPRPRTGLFGNKNTMEHGLHAGLAQLGHVYDALDWTSLVKYDLEFI